jgi:hypothetical protein
MPEIEPFTVRDNARADHGTFRTRSGFSIELWLQLASLDPGQVLLDNRTKSGKGFCLHTADRGTLEIILNDGRTENRWDCDPGMIKAGKLHHIVVTVDGGPCIITFVIDGQLNDGGAFRQFGWGRFSPHLRGVNGSDFLRISPYLVGAIHQLRIYSHALLTSEAVGNFKAGKR